MKPTKAQERERQAQAKVMFDLARQLGINPVKDEGKTQMGLFDQVSKVRAHEDRRT